MIIKCSYCSGEFSKKPSQIKRSKNHFCSKDCNNEWMTGKSYPERSNKVKHNCHQCNNDIIVENHKYKKFLSGDLKDLFCDKVCLADWQKVNFKGDKSSRYNSINKGCEYCFGDYVVSKVKSETSRFCSDECRIKGRVEDVSIKCDYCDENFTKKRAMIRNMNFCTKKCSARWSSENENKQVDIECEMCRRVFKVTRTRAESAKTCSKSCHYKWLSEVYSKTAVAQEHLTRSGITTQSKTFGETKPERILKEFLIHNKVDYIEQHPMYDKFIVDFFIPKENMVVEVFGDYWHGNELFYGKGDGLKELSTKQIKQKNKDKARQAYLEKCGHSFYILWENDIYHNLEEITKFL